MCSRRLAFGLRTAKLGLGCDLDRRSQTAHAANHGMASHDCLSAKVPGPWHYAEVALPWSSFGFGLVFRE